MVMIMTTIMREKDMQATPTSAPVMPTRQEYRDGMNKLRARLNCPVLSPDDQAIADELREFDWDSQSRNGTQALPLWPEQDTPAKRPTVDDYLKKQYQANMMARYPEFERRTDTDVAAIKQALDQMYVFNIIVVMAVVFALVIAVFAWLI